MKILYFTGTGNSLFVAKKIGETSEDTQLLSIAKELHNDHPIYKDEEAIGIVCPTYGHDIPTIVSEFIDKASFQAPYIFVVATYGNMAGPSCAILARALEARGIKVDYANRIVMVDNYVNMFNMTKQRQMDKKIDEHLASIIKDVQDRRKYTYSPSIIDNISHKVTKWFMEVPLKSWNVPTTFSVTDDCIHCKTCAKVCPRGNVTATDEKTTFGNYCEFCLACLHSCPKQAIVVKHDKSIGDRFRNEGVKLSEIIKSNEQ